MDTKNKGFADFYNFVEKADISEVNDLVDNHGFSLLFMAQRSHNAGYDDNTGYMIMHEIVYVLGKEDNHPGDGQNGE